MPAGNPTLQAYLNTTTGGSQDYAFASLHELAFGTAIPEFMPQVYSKYYKLYGDGFRLTTFLNAAGLIIGDWNSSRYTCFEEPSIEKTVTTEDPIVVNNAGDDIVIDIVAGDAAYRLLNMSIFIPGEYCNGGVSNTPKEYRVHTYSMTTGIGAATPLDATTEITTEVPAGIEITVGAAKYGRGGGQPGGTRNTNLQRDFFTTIVAETQQMEGGINTFNPLLGTLDSNGSKTLYAKGLWKGEFLLERAKDKALWVSELNTNSVTSVKRDGSTANVESFVGMRNHLDARANQLPHQNGLEPQDLKKIVEIAESQGVMADMWYGAFGARLYESMQDAGFDFVKEFSGGQVLLDNMGHLGAEFKLIDMYGLKLVISKLQTLSDITSFGNPSYKFNNEGFIMPSVNIVTTGTGGEKLTLPNMGIGYRRGNGENREKMFGLVSGVNGMGFPTVDSFDSTDIYWKTEFGLVMLGVNQMVNVVNL